MAVWPPGPDTRPVGGFALPTVALLFEVRDPGEVEARLRHLATVAARNHRGLPEPVEERQGDVSVRRLALGEGFELTWGYLGRWLFITTGSARGVATAAASGGLGSSAEYRRAARPLPAPNTGVAYVDFAGILRWLEALGPAGPMGQARQSEAWWRPLLAPLGALTSASRTRDGWIEQVMWLEVRR